MLEMPLAVDCPLQAVQNRKGVLDSLRRRVRRSRMKVVNYLTFFTFFHRYLTKKKVKFLHLTFDFKNTKI